MATITVFATDRGIVHLQTFGAIVRAVVLPLADAEELYRQHGLALDRLARGDVTPFQEMRDGNERACLSWHEIEMSVEC